MRGFESPLLRQSRNPLFPRDCGFFLAYKSFADREDGSGNSRDTVQICLPVTHEKTAPGGPEGEGPRRNFSGPEERACKLSLFHDKIDQERQEERGI